MKNSLLLFLLIFANAVSVHAGGHDVGNGGDAIVCPNSTDGGVSVELLDYFEARTILKWAVDLGPEIPDSDGREMALRAVDRMVSHHPVTARFYRERIEHFFEDARIENGMALHQIADTNVFVLNENDANPAEDSKLKNNYLLIPAHCKMVQLAIRRNREKVPDHKTFTLNGDLWRRMKPLQRAGLILHEVLFEDMLLTDEFGRIPLEHPEPDSRDVRYMNAFFSNPSLFESSDAAYLELTFLRGWFIEDVQMPDLLSSSHSLGGQSGLWPSDRDVQVLIGGRTYRALRGSEYKKSGDFFKMIVLAEDTVLKTPAGEFVAAAGTPLEFNGAGFGRVYLARDAKFRLPEGGSLEARGNENHGPVAQVEPTDFFGNDFPMRFFTRDYRVSSNEFTIRNLSGQLDVSPWISWTLRCDGRPSHFCVELYRTGRPHFIALGREPNSMFSIEILAQGGQAVNLSDLWAQADRAHRFGGKPALRLPRRLEFDAQGFAICPYRDEATKECQWLERDEP